MFQRCLLLAFEDSLFGHREARPAVTVAVRDDGPGLPVAEQRILEGKEETPLEHGLGVGLWLVTWLVTSIGGEVDYEENDPRGSVVRLTFPEGVLSWPDA